MLCHRPVMTMTPFPTRPTSASRRRSNSRGKAGRTPKPRRKNRDTVNNIQEDSFSDSERRMRATRMAEVSQGEKADNLRITVDTGSKYNIVDQTEAADRGWKVEKLTESEQPSLRYADGRKMPIYGRTSLWIRLDKRTTRERLTDHWPHRSKKTSLDLSPLAFGH